MSTQITPAPGLDWLVDNFVSNTIGVRHAVVLSADGLMLAAGGDVPTDKADRLAAVASGVYSLAIGTADVFDLGPYEQSILRFAGGHLLITALAKGAALAVISEPDAPMGVIAHQMALFAGRVGQNLNPSPRSLQPLAAP